MNANKQTISIPIDGSRICDDCRVAFHGDVCPGCGTERCTTLSAALYPIDSRKAWAEGVLKANTPVNALKFIRKTSGSVPNGSH